MKRSAILVVLLAIFAFLCLPVCAEEQDELNEEMYFDSIFEAIPEEVKPYIDESYIEYPLTVQSVASISSELIGSAIVRFLKTFSELLILIIFASMMTKLKQAFSQGGDVLGLIPSLLLITYLISALLSYAQTTEVYCQGIQSFMSVAAATVGGVMVLGGNTISSSVMMTAVLSVSLLLESTCLVLLVPTVRLSLISLLSYSAPQNGLQAIGRISRNFFQWLIGIVSFVSVTVFTYQSLIAQAEDSISANTLRYAITGSVPVVGGAIGESLQTITSSVNMLRSSIGGLGVAILIVYAMMPLFGLLSFKFAVFMMEEISNALAIDRVKELLGETRKLANMMIAIIVIVTVLYLFILSVFVLLPLANT